MLIVACGLVHALCCLLCDVCFVCVARVNACGALFDVRCLLGVAYGLLVVVWCVWFVV